MQVPLLDLKAQYAAIKDEVDAAVADVFASQHFIGGPHVAACEGAVAAYCGGVKAVGVSSGTDALLVALMAEGIGPGDEVITTSYTFFATGGSIARTGATPVFVDIDPETLNLDAALAGDRITDRTKAIMPVHLYGQMADMDAVMALADRHGLVVIEDAAQAIGAEHQGYRAGTRGHYGCFSFFPSKNLGGAGDGGMVVSKDPARAARVALLRNHGAQPKYYHNVIGGNFRLDALQAAVVTVKLRHLDAWTEARQSNAKRYDRLFAQCGLTSRGVRLPTVVASRHIFNQYVIRAPRRDALREHLTAQGVGTEVYYPVPFHLQACFAHLGYRAGDCPESERAANETLALPVYPEVTDEQAEAVVAAMDTFLA
jgi:dTDP-4-amino-4,6-dideoxygalactose transaminase